MPNANATLSEKIVDAYLTGRDDAVIDAIESTFNDAQTRLNIDSFAELATVTDADTGDIVVWREKGFRYQCVTSDEDFDYTGMGGLKWVVLPDPDGLKPVMAWGLAADGTTDDTTKVQAAFDSLISGQGLSFPPKTIFTNGCITHTVSNTKINFNGTTLKIGDTGTAGVLVTTASGKIGYLFKETDDLHMTGSFYAIGQGTLGSTSLAGMVFDNCERVQAPCSMHFSTMAAGRFIVNCDNSHFGSVIGQDMRGLQTFENPPTVNAGSTEVVSGCQYSVFGDATGYDTDKPVRYMSLDSSQRKTKGCKIGASIAKNYTSSTTSHALTIRNSSLCSYGPVIAEGPYAAVNIVSYSGDTVEIDNNHIDSVIGETTASAASVDTLFYQYVATGSNEIGTTTVGSIIGSAGGEFGILVTSGAVKIGSAVMTGAATRLVAVYSGGSGTTATLSIGSLIISGNSSSSSPVNVGKGGRLEIGDLYLKTGPSAAATAGCRYEPALGTGANHEGYSIKNIYYRQNGSSNNYAYVFMDLTNGYEAGYIGNIDDNAATSGARFGADAFEVKHGRYASAAIPTTGIYTQGSVIWDTNAASGATPGWYIVFSLATTLTATEPSGETSMAVASGTGTANGDIIGVMQDNGTIRWTTISSGGGTTTLVLSAALTADATSGSAVYIWRPKAMANLA